MFTPIALKGRRLAVQICHDMFFGFLGQRMKKGGADIFLDITGGGVNARKWSNVVRGRSLELAARFYARWRSAQETAAVARTFAFHSGTPWKAAVRNVEEAGFGGYEIFAVERSAPAVAAPQDEGVLTSKRYRDITIGRRPGTTADISINPTRGVLRPARLSTSAASSWRYFESQAGPVGVLPLPLTALRDGLALYRRLPPRDFQHHLAVYFSKATPSNFHDFIALAKLRAIEHRLAIVIVAGGRQKLSRRTAIRTSSGFAKWTTSLA